jgi:hypothetical protein
MDSTVSSFITAFPMIAQAGWKFASVAAVLDDHSGYKNTDSSGSSPVVSEDVLGPIDNFGASASGYVFSSVISLCPNLTTFI